MQIRALASLKVFAVDCLVTGESIQAGIVALNDDFQPGFHTLYDVDTMTPYPVEILSTIRIQYKACYPLQSQETMNNSK